MAEETEKTTDTALSFTLENLAGYAPVQINKFVSRLVKELVLKDPDHVGQIIQGEEEYDSKTPDIGKSYIIYFEGPDQNLTRTGAPLSEAIPDSLYVLLFTYDVNHNSRASLEATPREVNLTFQDQTFPKDAAKEIASLVQKILKQPYKRDSDRAGYYGDVANPAFKSPYSL